MLLLITFLPKRRSSPKRIEGSDGRNLELQFRTRLSLPLFTGGKVEGEQGAAIHVVLINADTGCVVTSGPESSVKLDVVVLEGDFNNEDDDTWTQEEFDSHIVKEREGKRPLLTGELQVTLKDGVGTLAELTFTDNSSWIGSRKFRIGLKVSPGFCEGIRIREAKTDAFTVKVHRGELYEKHYPPSLHDEVWRLEKIGKDGSFNKRLNKAGIFTVEDFLTVEDLLRLVVRDSQKLRNILGSGMSNKMWDALVDHAKTCVLSWKRYVYCPDDARNVGVVFNNIHQFSGLIADGQYISPDSLSDDQKVHVDTLVKKAYDNWMHVIEYDGKSLFDFNHENTGASGSEFPMGQQEYSNIYDYQLAPPSLSVPVSMDQPPADSGYNDGISTRYQIQPQSVNVNTTLQFDGSSFPLQNPLISSSHQTQLLSLGPPPASASSFYVAGPSSLPSHRGTEELFSEEEICMRSHEMLENEDMQHLFRIFNMGGHSVTRIV